MTFIILAELAVIGAGVAAMPWLRRAGEREWRAHRTRILAAPIADAFAAFGRAIGDALTPALRTGAAAIQGFAAGLARDDAIRQELVRLTLGGRPERPELIPTEETR